MKSDARLTRATLLLFAGAVGGLFGVLFQFRASSLLGDTSFASFSHWLFVLNVLSLPAVIFQTSGNLRADSALSSRWFWICSTGACALALCVAVLSAGPSGLLAAVALMSAVTSIYVGMLQARQAYAALILAAALPMPTRLLVAECLARADVAMPFERGVVVSSVVAVAIVLTAWTMVASPKPSSKTPAMGSWRRVLVGGVSLAVATMVLPFADFEFVRVFAGADAAVSYAKPAFLGRIIFFGGQVYSQALVPRLLELRNGRGHTRAAIGLVALCVLGTIVLFGATEIAKRYGALNVAGVSAPLLLIACCCHTLFALLFFALQSAVLSRR